MLSQCPYSIDLSKEQEFYITYPGVMPCMYSITISGVIRNIQRNHIMSQYINGGYLKCNLMRSDGTQSPFSLHRLIAWEFVLSNRDFNLTVNHIDGNKLNNNPLNLEWITSGENVSHAWRTGLIPNNINQGETHGMSKLTDAEVHIICSMLQDPKTTFEEVLKVIDYKVDIGIIRGIAAKRSWIHISSQYNIPPRDHGEVHSNSAKLDADKVHRICKLLENPMNTYEYIAEQFKDVCSVHAIIDIAHGRTWTHISSQYNIPPRSFTPLRQGVKHNMAKLTEEDVHLICQLLQDTDLKYADIAARLNNKVSIHTISGIFKRKTWNNISYQYDFSDRE